MFYFQVDEKDRADASSLMKCEICDSAERHTEQLMCWTCGSYYHPGCLWTSSSSSSSSSAKNKTSTALAKIGWQCPECKRCPTCKKTDDDAHMLVCDKCDRCFHTYCIPKSHQPDVNKSSGGAWLCELCEHEVDLAKTCAGCKCPLISTNPLLNMCGTCLANEKKAALANPTANTKSQNIPASSTTTSTNTSTTTSPHHHQLETTPKVNIE